MIQLTQEQFNDLLASSAVKPRLRRELRFVPSTSDMTEEDWESTELLAIKDRSGNKGVLVISIDSGVYVLPYEFKKISPSSTTGRASAVICDFCMTWQSGSRAGSILFPNIRNASTSVGFLCCADLACSKHVRTKTDASKISRAQLREDMDDEKRTERLKHRLEDLITSLQVTKH